MILIHGCTVCGKSFYREPQSRYCRDCMGWAVKVAIKASRAVARAVKRGQLPHISTQYCADCGAFASIWDHRDYTKPLYVIPVCRSCNIRRGPADVFPQKEAA